jgi:hypothetical protein
VTLREAIDAYRTDVAAAGGVLSQHAIDALTRLHESDLAIKAVAAMTDDGIKVRDIIYTCLECETLCRNFYQDVVAAKDRAARLAALEIAAADLAAFIKETAAGPSHGLASYVVVDPAEAAELRNALYCVRLIVGYQRKIDAATPVRFGATNKLSGGDETASIGWLADGIERINGRPHYAHVARLAEVILNAKDITADRVREALRTRRAQNSCQS